MSKLKKTMNKIYIDETEDYYKKYNETINFINLKSRHNHFEKLNDIDLVFKLRSILNIRKLERILYTFKQLEDPNMHLSHLIVNPYDFINMDPLVSLLTYNQALKIEKEFNLSISMNVKLEKFIIAMFISSENPDCDIYIKKQDFANHLFKMIRQNSISDEFSKEIINKVCVKHKEFGNTYYTTKYFDELQRNLTNTILQKYINNNTEELIAPELIDHHINKYQKKHSSLLFNSEQRKSIHNLVDRNSRLKIIIGPPGTGKTTITDCAIYCLKSLYPNKYDNIILTAPTGKATNNIIDSCSIEISGFFKCNLIKLLLSVFKDVGYYRYNNSELDELYDLLGNDEYSDRKESIMKKIDKIELFINYELNIIIIDEASIIDIIYMDKLIKMLGNLFKFPEIWFIGDTNQLEPIGGGFPFKDLINSGKFTINKLTEIKRCTGHLKKCIEKLTNGESLIREDFEIDDSINFIDINELTTYENRIIKLEKDKIHNFMIKHNLTTSNNKYISPQKKYTHGVFNINKIIQSIFNKNNFIKKYDFKNDNKINTNFKIGDKILRTKNVYTDDGDCYVNGDMATILEQTRKLKVIIKYDKDEFNTEISVSELEEEFMNSDAFTIHKAQGSGYENIVIFISKLHKSMWTRNNSLNLLYTGISRAKQRCFIIGDYDLLIKSQKTKFISRPSIFMKKL
jgi:ATP-dependent exoDNAse (exonuclease V) alpha subunit